MKEMEERKKEGQVQFQINVAQGNLWNKNWNVLELELLKMLGNLVIFGANRQGKLGALGDAREFVGGTKTHVEKGGTGPKGVKM